VLVTAPPASSACTYARALCAGGASVAGVDDFDPYYDVALKEARARTLATHPVSRLRARTWPTPTPARRFSAPKRRLRSCISPRSRAFAIR
jgi:hypothetical protein